MNIFDNQDHAEQSVQHAYPFFDESIVVILVGRPVSKPYREAHVIGHAIVRDAKTRGNAVSRPAAVVSCFIYVVVFNEISQIFWQCALLIPQFFRKLK